MRVLVTSCGGAVGIGVIRALRKQKDFEVEIFGADIDNHSVGIRMCDVRVVLPEVKDEDYIFKVIKCCKTFNIDLIIPCYHKEIIKFAEAKDNIAWLSAAKVIVSSPETVELCNNKRTFYSFLEQYGYTYPRLICSIEDDLPVFVKPEAGSGSNEARLIDDLALVGYYRANDFIIQEYIAGNEYTVDLFCDKNHNVTAHCIRERLDVRDGQCIQGVTVKYPELSGLIVELAKDLGLVGPANIQVIEAWDEDGTLYIIECNPRLAAGGLSLSVEAGVNIPLMMLCKAANREMWITDYKIIGMTKYHECIFW